MLEFSVEWARAAREDLFEIVDHIARERPLVAFRVSERIDRGALSLRNMPRRGRRPPELADDRAFAALMQNVEVRELILKPWRLLYRVESQRVIVVAVVDSRRDMQAWLNRHLSRLTATDA